MKYIREDYTVEGTAEEIAEFLDRRARQGNRVDYDQQFKYQQIMQEANTSNVGYGAMSIGGSSFTDHRQG